jgi:DNA replicative helicase MCM subunit Mcm2 (Cdc46/Mcm family)
VQGTKDTEEYEETIRILSEFFEGTVSYVHGDGHIIRGVEECNASCAFDTVVMLLYFLRLQLSKEEELTFMLAMPTLCKHMRDLNKVLQKADVSKDEQLKSLAAFKLNVMSYVMQAASPFTVGEKTSIDSIMEYLVGHGIEYSQCSTDGDIVSRDLLLQTKYISISTCTHSTCEQIGEPIVGIHSNFHNGFCGLTATVQASHDAVYQVDRRSLICRVCSNTMDVEIDNSTVILPVI